MPSAPAHVTDPDLRLERLLALSERLHRFIARLSRTVRSEDVAAIVVDDGIAALHAAGGALWEIAPGGDRLTLLRALAIPPPLEEAWRELAVDPQYPIGDAVARRQAVWISSRAEHSRLYPASIARARIPGLSASLCVLPVVLDDRVLGALALLFGDERPFDRDERGYLTLLALHCAQGLERAHLHGSETRARAAAEAAEGRAAFLSCASALLGSSLDYEETLGNVAKLAVPTIADWCVIDLVGDDGLPRQVALTHADSAKAELAREVRRRFPPVPSDRAGVTNVLRTGEAEMISDITDAMVATVTRSADHLRLLREVGPRSLILVPIKDRGRVLGVLTFVLTARERRYDRDDLRMAEQLGERAGAAIANAMLYAEARAAIRVREDFLLVAGHELRTPLAALSLHVDALAELPDDAVMTSVRQRATKLRAQTDRVARLVEDLLDVSKITAGRLELEREDVDLGALVREVLDRVREDVERARAVLVLAIEPVRGHWDRSRIDQLASNLIGNALRYGKGHPVQVVVRRRGDHAVFVVSDLGIGIAPEHQARIFERFERAVSTRHFGGLGLGLWIARELVTAHGGTIALASAPGRGATVAVSLPLAT